MAIENPKAASNPLVGSIQIELYLSEAGISIAYGFEGMEKDAAIGYLQTVQDRLRDERRNEWATCPSCKLPWEEHFADEEDEEDDD